MMMIKYSTILRLLAWGSLLIGGISTYLVIRSFAWWPGVCMITPAFLLAISLFVIAGMADRMVALEAALQQQQTAPPVPSVRNAQPKPVASLSQRISGKP